MSNVSAGIGRGQMEVLDKHIDLRRDMNSFYNQLFKDIKGAVVQQEPDASFHSNFWLSCILIEENAPFSKVQFQEEMDKVNIETRPLWKPMHMQPVFKDAPYYGDNESEVLFHKGL